MSLPTSATGSSRRFRAPSETSRSSPRFIPGSLNTESQDEASGSIADFHYGSFHRRREPQASASQLPALSGNREPTRSSVHLSYRGQIPAIDNIQYSRSVREDTNLLANYALSDQASVRSMSPPPRRSMQSYLEHFFTNDSELGTSPNRSSDGLLHSAIDEVSEPVSPENGSVPDRSPGTSVLTNMLKHSPPSSLPTNDGRHDDESPLDRDKHTGETVISQPRLELTANGPEIVHSEHTPLLRHQSQVKSHITEWAPGDRHSDIEALDAKPRVSKWPSMHDIHERGLECARILINPKSWDRKAIGQAGVDTYKALPAVLLGVLLNVLDALSYGMILFPLGTPIFAKFGAAGISMFYVSTVISQLVYSLGGSIFKGGVGSEMIEVVPFFHKMALFFVMAIEEDNPEAVIATTITSYAISAIVTGIVFGLIGLSGYGYLVGFIPRHILTGCIGGVGFFLIVTGVEVTAGLDGNLNYDLATLKHLFQADTVFLWTIPLLLGAFEYYTEPLVKKHYEHYLPTFILAIPAVLYFIKFQHETLTMGYLRSHGWVFEAPEAGEPWWYFYTLYNFRVVRWDVIAQQIPTMLALTFFGLLHVPINVPSLAFAVGEDNMRIDREFIAHGLSNCLSGFAGSIQNYLVYTNSVIFMKSGGDTRIGGVLLGVFTAIVMFIGPTVIGYIPKTMVGTLIYILGIDLFLEAVWLPRKKLKLLEYLTVLAIVFIMGIYDFVVGIAVGIGLAFVFLVLHTSNVSAIRASLTGAVAQSTVRRNATQSRYLRGVGQQIHVTKLAGYLFFGTIFSVEQRIRALIEDEAFEKRPIRFLILDLQHVTGCDYTAAEAFNTVNRLISKKGMTMFVSGIPSDGEFCSMLRKVGLGVEGNEVTYLESLNGALEDCENELLKTFYASREARASRHAPTEYIDVPTPGRNDQTHSFSLDIHSSSPRRNHLFKVASNALDENSEASRYTNFSQPLKLILQTFHSLTDKNEDFWFRALPYFVKKEFVAGTVLFNAGDLAQGFYLLQEGILRADYEMEQGRYYESIVAGTTCGELPFFSGTNRTATVQAERDCVTWMMDRENWDKLRKSEPDVAQELTEIALKLTSERMNAITSYVMMTAG